MGGACVISILILGFTTVDTGILRRDVQQEQSVLLLVVEELVFGAAVQSLGVFVPGHLWLWDAAYQSSEADRSA